jgi:hypothetical protein
MMLPVIDTFSFGFSISAFPMVLMPPPMLPRTTFEKDPRAALPSPRSRVFDLTISDREVDG